MSLCHHCGTKYGTVVLSNMRFEEGICSCCKKQTNVTEDRVYGYPNYPGNTLTPGAQSILRQAMALVTD